ncbi:MAG: DUF1552 domain-containing protein [Archangiaceae bacterium]|nr:DUF1552 domain-containing protein [Archangiaceae bacterium]
MKPLSRRLVLRGAAGFGLSLPLLEAMLDGKAWAQAQPPKRYLLGFAGCSLGGYDGNIAQTLVPTTVGASYDLKPALANLAPVKSQVTVVTGLKLPWAVNGVVPAGGKAVQFHYYQVAPLLTGQRSTDGSFSKPTTEHLAGDLLGGNTTFKTLVTRVQVSSYVDAAQPGTGQAISFRQNGTSVQQVPPRYSPQQLFQALFGNFAGNGLTPDQVAEQKWLVEQRRSVLDGVGDRMTKLKARLGVADQRRVDAHLAEFRELETRVAAIPPPMAGTCLKPADPGADPTVGGNQQTNTEGNITYAQNLGYSGEDARAKAMCDLIHMAITCDLTRSVLLQFTNSQSFMNMQAISGQKSDLHELSHGGFGNLTDADTTQALARGINWHMKHWAYLLAKLQATPEPGGSVLSNMAAIFTWEGGHGLDPADGRAVSAHSTENMAMLVAGGAGGLKGGLHLKATGLHPSQVLLTGLRAVGYTGTALGEVSGEIPGLR